MSRIGQIAEEVATLMPMIARRVLLEFFQSVTLTQTQIFTIMTLAEEAPIQLSYLSKKLHISGPTVTGIVDRLEKQGYVKRELSSVPIVNSDVPKQCYFIFNF